MKYSVEYFDEINSGCWEELDSCHTLEDAYTSIAYFKSEDLKEEQYFKYRILEDRVIHETE